MKNTNYANVARYGVMLVSITKGTQRFVIYKFRNKYFEFDLLMGEPIEEKVTNEAQKYLSVLISSKENNATK